MDKIKERLLELAQAQRSVEELTAKMDAAYDEHVRPILQELNDAIKVEKDLDEALRRDALTYVMETGDVGFNDRIIFVRNKRVMYEPSEVLELAKKEQPDLVKIKHEEKLDVRKFEALAREGKATWAQYEVVNAPTIRIESLTSLLD